MSFRQSSGGRPSFSKLEDRVLPRKDPAPSSSGPASNNNNNNNSNNPSTSTRRHPSPYQPRIGAAKVPYAKDLTPTYKQLNRRLLGIYVGLPVAIVSGYTLYLRETFGVEQRHFDGSPMEKADAETAAKEQSKRPKMF